MKKEIAIEVKNVSKYFRLPHQKTNTLRGAFVRMFQKNTYENFTALNDVSFEVKKGEFFTIIGTNGSGKSTLLSILAHIYHPDGGSVQIAGALVPFLALGIGFNPELSGRDNVFLNGTILGMTKKEMQDRFDDIVAFAEMERFIDQKVGNYSSGMRARLAFSVAIHVHHDILLMDEVLAVGDEKFKEKCLSMLNSFIAKGKTIVFVSHSLDIVKKYSDRVMVLYEGKNKGIFSPEEGIQLYRSLLDK